MSYDAGAEGYQAMQDLRQRILDGNDVTPEEMLAIINERRQNRRSAAEGGTTTRGRKKAAAAPLDLGSLFPGMATE